MRFRTTFVRVLNRKVTPDTDIDRWGVPTKPKQEEVTIEVTLMSDGNTTDFSSHDIVGIISERLASIEPKSVEI